MTWGAVHLDFWYFMQIVAAVIAANAASFAFFMGAMKASKEQKAGKKEDQLPLWVYPCLIVPPLIVSLGAYLLH
jgi:hypothetical protein